MNGIGEGSNINSDEFYSFRFEEGNTPSAPIVSRPTIANDVGIDHENTTEGIVEKGHEIDFLHVDVD
ncbi:hypothetical protein BGX20_001907 [Mortierella sp. AD010]|nr:hypothetical protein BGX20_001907 [Mortierella sp. AD010]